MRLRIVGLFSKALTKNFQTIVSRTALKAPIIAKVANLLISFQIIQISVMTAKAFVKNCKV